MIGIRGSSMVRYSFAAPILIALTIAASAFLPAQIITPDSWDRDAGLPFSSSERLVFSVHWDPPWYLFFLPTMEAGEADIQLMGETAYKDRKALKITFKVRSSGTLVNLAGVKVEDDFIYLTDLENLCTLSVSKKMHEGKRKREINVVYFPDTQRLYIHEVDTAVVPPKIKKNEFKDGIPKCVKDPFSALYFVRLKPLAKGQVHRLMIGDNDKVAEVQSIVEEQEVVETVLGKVVAWRINTVALLGGLFREGGQFRIWLSADERKIPVQFEAKVKLGKVVGKLKLLQ